MTYLEELIDDMIVIGHNKIDNGDFSRIEIHKRVYQDSLFKHCIDPFCKYVNEGGGDAHYTLLEFPAKHMNVYCVYIKLPYMS